MSRLDERMLYGSTIDWRILSSYVGGGCRKIENNNETLKGFKTYTVLHAKQQHANFKAALVNIFMLTTYHMFMFNTCGDEPTENDNPTVKLSMALESFLVSFSLMFWGSDLQLHYFILASLLLS